MLRSEKPSSAGAASVPGFPRPLFLDPFGVLGFSPRGPPTPRLSEAPGIVGLPPDSGEHVATTVSGAEASTSEPNGPRCLPLRVLGFRPEPAQPDHRALQLEQAPWRC